MTIPDRLLSLREEDIENDNAEESDQFAELQNRLRNGTLKEGDDEVSLNIERRNMIFRALRRSDAMFSTLAACGEEPIKLCGSRPNFLWSEEGSRITIPSALVAFAACPKAYSCGWRSFTDQATTITCPQFTHQQRVKGVSHPNTTQMIAFQELRS